jgi:hypothetical protein
MGPICNITKQWDFKYKGKGQVLMKEIVLFTLNNVPVCFQLSKIGNFSLDTQCMSKPFQHTYRKRHVYHHLGNISGDMCVCVRACACGKEVSSNSTGSCSFSKTFV